MFEKIRSECLGLVKHIYEIQTVTLIRQIKLQGVSKICLSFADKYSFIHKELSHLKTCSIYPMYQYTPQFSPM